MKRTVPAILLVLGFSIRCAIGSVSITVSNETRMVAGQALLPNDPSQPGDPVLASSQVIFPDPLFSYPVTMLSVAWTGSQWTPHLFTGSKPNFSPGHGFFIKIHGNATLIVPDPTMTISPPQIPAGYSIICCQSNVPATFEMMVGRAPDEGTRIYRLLPNNGSAVLVPPDGNTNYLAYSFSGGAWAPQPPVAEAGEAVWILQPPTISNLHLTNGAVSFDVLTASGGGTPVEWTTNLTGMWQVLTNFGGGGGVSNVLDPADVTTNAQRFFRVHMSSGG